MQVKDNQAGPQDGREAKTFPRTDKGGNIWVVHGPNTKKPYRVFEPGEDIKSSRRFKAATEDQARQAFRPEPQTENHRPPILEMDDEELNELPDFDDVEEEPAKQQTTDGKSDQQARGSDKQSNSDYAALLAAARVSPTDIIEQPPVCLTIGQDDSQCVVGTLGNISAMIGKAKAKKTFAVTFAVAAAVAGKLILNRIKGTLPTGQQTVLLFDTEQSRYHVLKVVRRICTLVGISEPPNLIVYSLRPYSPGERLNLINYALNHTTGVGMAVIDGVRDLQVDPILDAEQASKIITHLLKWTTELNIHIMAVLHQNKADSNARGHLGTELTNKAETVITITKDQHDKEISIATPEYSRDKDFEPFAFSINEQGLPFVVEDWQGEQRPAPRKGASNDDPPKVPRTVTITPGQLTTDQHGAILRRAFANVTPDKYGVTCHRIKAAGEHFGHKFGDNKAKEFVTYYIDAGLLFKAGQTYTLNLSPAETTDSVLEKSGLV